MFKETTAQRKISKLRKRVRVIQGGSSSSKTFTIIPLLITYAIQVPNSEISIVSESIPHLRRGAIRDFIKIMQWTSNFTDANWNKSSLTYTFNNGSYIEFFSADQPDKMRGARRDVLFINECNNINFETYQQLAIRTRKFIYLDYNPSSEFWVHTELIGDSDTDFIILTYKDNEALEPSIVREIEKNRDKAEKEEAKGERGFWWNWWQVYGLGLIGSLQGVVFRNWELIDTLPNEARLLGYGMDFGFTNDPTTLTAVYEHEGQYIFHELIYETGLLNNQLHSRMVQNEVSKSKTIYADSADPKTIAELRRYGWKVEGADKGEIMYGIAKMQEATFKVTSTSTNLIKELKYYIWATDKSGKSLNKPIDDFNHAIDGVRYYFHSFRKNKGRYVVV
jgi:phage terminase large subunit